jgi:hypothetical protein
MTVEGNGKPIQYKIDFSSTWLLSHFLGSNLLTTKWNRW